MCLCSINKFIIFLRYHLITMKMQFLYYVWNHDKYLLSFLHDNVGRGRIKHKQQLYYEGIIRDKGSVKQLKHCVHSHSFKFSYRADILRDECKKQTCNIPHALLNLKSTCITRFHASSLYVVIYLQEIKT